MNEASKISLAIALGESFRKNFEDWLAQQLVDGLDLKKYTIDYTPTFTSPHWDGGDRYIMGVNVTYFVKPREE